MLINQSSKTALVVLAAAAVLFFAGLPGAMAANIQKGSTTANEAGCVGCHGADGVSVADPSFPILAGQYPDFIERALLDYQRGARNNAIMTGIAATLSKEDIKNLAAYYASQPSPLKIIKR